MAHTKFEATPLFVQDSLVFCSPFNEVIALDPGTGAQKWRYDPNISTAQRPANRYNCRGVTHWVDAQAAANAACRARIFMGTNDARLIALDARTGIPCAGFGDKGEVKPDIGKPLHLARRIPDHLRAGGKPRRRHRRLLDIGQCPRRCTRGDGARLRCADREAALELGSAGSATALKRAPPMSGRRCRRTRAEGGVPADLVAEPGFLGRQASRQ